MSLLKVSGKSQEMPGDREENFFLSVCWWVNKTLYWEALSADPKLIVVQIVSLSGFLEEG